MPSLALMLAVVIGVVLAFAVAWLVASRRRLPADRDRFADFLEHGPFLAFMKDAEGRYVYENRAVMEHIRRIRPGMGSLIGRTDREVFPAAEGQTYIDHDRRVVEKGRPLHFDEVSVDADGTIRNWSTVKFPRADALGRPGIAGISIDVTALLAARIDAQSSQARCAVAVEAGRMGTFTLDLATQSLDTSPMFATLHGRDATKTRLGLEESLADVHPEDRPKIIEAVQAALRDRAPNRIGYRVVLPSGDIRWLELMGRVFADEAGRPLVVHGVGFDVSEARQAFDELANRKAILRRLIEVQENERQTLCHELHDGLIQYAVAAKMQLDSARDEADASVRARRIDAAIDCLERGIAEGRHLIRGVRPPVLDDLGLAAAIEDLVEQMAAAGMTVERSLDEGLDRVPPQIRTTIYRVVQESLTNVRKHAGTDRAVVEIHRIADEAHVRISDRGVGFDVEAARSRGFGLTGMIERVRLAGGTFCIESRPDAGTRVHARLPTSSTAMDASPAMVSRGRAREEAGPFMV